MSTLLPSPPALGDTEETAPRGSPDGGALASAWFTPLIVTAVAILSVALTGFQFDIYNNAYHIPIVLGWLDDPAFQADPVVPTLHLFATPLYRLLSPVATEANVAALFLLLMLAGRIATFWAFDAIGRELGVRGFAARTAFLLVLATSIGIYNTSAIGADGLLIPYFTHSELAQGVALLSVAAMFRGELTKAALLAGLTFDINAFIGVWMLAPLGLLCIDRLARADDPRIALTQVMRAALAFTVVAAPVLIWILASQAGLPAPQGFDYGAFLADFFPLHFFIGAATASDRALAMAQLISALTAILMLPRRRTATLILAGFVLVCLAGMMVGALSSNRWLLNMHLMRSAGMIVFLSTLLVVAAAFAAMKERRIATVATATLILLGVLTNRWLLVLPAIILLFLIMRQVARSQGSNQSLLARSWVLAPACGAALVAIAGTSIATSNCCYGRDPPWEGRSTPTNRELMGSAPSAPHWKAVQSWARAHTAPDAMFLVPRDFDFRTGARRPVWVTDKDGGAVPWAPSLYPLWKSRIDQVSALRGVDDQRRYACRNGIDYVVVDGRKPVAGFSEQGALFRNRYFAVFAPMRPPACL